MGKKVLTGVALLLTVGLALLLPRLGSKPEAEQSGLKIIRLWTVESDPAVSAWLRGRAAAYEKETGLRVYLRSATPAEALAAQEGAASIVPPDLILRQGAGDPVARMGYALIVRDETVAVVTPAPTSALFYRPTPPPGPSPTPAPTKNPASLSAVLSPEGLALSLPGVIPSRDPAGDLAAGKAAAAVLTAGQAGLLPFGYQAYALAAGEGALPVGARAFSEDGRAFQEYLKTPQSQQALAAHGLYGVLPGLRLYGAEEPLRTLIEGSLP